MLNTVVGTFNPCFLSTSSLQPRQQPVFSILFSRFFSTIRQPTGTASSSASTSPVITWRDFPNWYPSLCTAFVLLPGWSSFSTFVFSISLSGFLPSLFLLFPHRCNSSFWSSAPHFFPSIFSLTRFLYPFIDPKTFPLKFMNETCNLFLQFSKKVNNLFFHSNWTLEYSWTHQHYPRLWTPRSQLWY